MAPSLPGRPLRPQDQVDAFYAKQSKDNEALVASRSGASDGNMDEQVANVKVR